LPIFKFHDILA